MNLACIAAGEPRQGRKTQEAVWAEETKTRKRAGGEPVLGQLSGGPAAGGVSSPASALAYNVCRPTGEGSDAVPTVAVTTETAGSRRNDNITTIESEGRFA